MAPLLGVAARRGWQSEHLDGELRLPVGRTGWRVCWSLSGPLHPGAAGDARTGACSLQRSAGALWAPLRLGDVPPVVFSEAMREVDLLAAVATHASQTDDTAQPGSGPVAAQTRRRRDVLARVLREVPQAEGVELTDRAALVPTPAGVRRVSLTTALVYDGEGVLLEPPDAASPPTGLPWLPYDSSLFGRVLTRVVALLAG